MADIDRSAAELVAEIERLRAELARRPAPHAPPSAGSTEARDGTSQREAQLEAIWETSIDGLVTVSTDGIIENVNPATEHLLGFTREELIGENVKRIIPPPVRDRHDDYIRRFRDTGISRVLGRGREVRALRRDGTTFPIELAVVAVRSHGRRTFEGTLRDITQRKKAQQAVNHLATHCSLTDLANRALFRDRVERALARAKRSQWSLAVLFLDLDRFKGINDELGHSGGDEVLRIVARRLLSSLRASDTAARLGGDEFAVLLSGITRSADAGDVARKLARAISQPIMIDGFEARVTTSIGIAVFPSDGDDVDELLRCADLAMYHAKQEGQNRQHFYSAELKRSSLLRLSIERDLRRAIEHDQLELHFQPTVNGETGRIVAAEALLRWNHPEKGLLQPAEFISLAEDTGMIAELGEWVLREACRWGREWRRAGLQHIQIGVNVSARQLWHDDFFDLVNDVVLGSGLADGCITLEITESCLMRDLDAIVSTLNALRNLGVRIAIDDFGTGYSSLGILKNLPLDALKIDRCFVSDIDDRPDAMITSIIISLARILALEPVAEGVETREQLEFLLENGCRTLQGFLFSAPLPEPAFRRLLATGRIAPGKPPSG
ncbi:MAG: putative bifunctional diguanylate cyclase/phosphodiesterase [Myxococcota bacterium]